MSTRAPQHGTQTRPRTFSRRFLPRRRPRRPIECDWSHESHRLVGFSFIISIPQEVPYWVHDDQNEVHIWQQYERGREETATSH